MIKGYRYIIVIFENFSEYTWCIPLKNEYGEKITKEFSNNLSTSRRLLLKIESDRGKEWYNSIFQKSLKVRNIHHYSRFTEKAPSKAKKFIRTVRNLLKKPVFLAGNADWLSDLPSITKKYNNTVHNSTKMTPIDASKK